MEEIKEKSELKSSVAFAVDDSNSGENSSKNNKKRTGMPRRSLSTRSSFRSSFFSLKGLSFRRSGGDRGADINTLRGKNGPDFEGYATIRRAGNNGISCGCFGGSGNNDDKKEKTILIKGAFCFVFVKETDPSPKYAISLAHTKTSLHPSSSSSPCRVTIETSLGDVEWELEFENKKLANQFTNAFRQQAAIGEADEARKRLGHGKLLNKRQSVKYAESVAQKKIQSQPEKKENVLLEDVNRVEPMMPGGYS